MKKKDDGLCYVIYLRRDSDSHAGKIFRSIGDGMVF